MENKVDFKSEVNERLNQICQGTQFNVDWKDRMAVIEHVENLLKHGRRLCERLSVCYQVANLLDLNYQYVADHKQPVFL